MKQNDLNTPVPTFEPKRRLSLFRVMLAFLLLVAFSCGATYGWKKWREDQAVAVLEPWFAAYVDATSTPHYAFEQLGSTSTPQVVLSFIVSDHEEACTPTWGGYFTLDQARESLDLDRRIARLQQQGGQVAISFGGLLNDELAVRCTDQDELLKAYQLVVERYNIDTIDLDLENTGLTNKEALERRSKVIAQLQSQRRSDGKSLAVWLTLPVAPQGLTPDGTDAVAVMLEHGVDLAGVNVMTMDYGGSKDPNDSMYEASKQALIETHRQLGILYEQAGINLHSKSIWRKIGATPMIGQNDVVEEVFTLEDAKKFNTYAREQGLGRMSMWSANRDLPCGENYVDTKVVSDSCSGVNDPKFSFSLALSEGYVGSMTQNATLITIEDPETSPQAVPDDPETSPYQIWHENGAYPEGVKVVWHGNVYEAKWWTKGDLPDNPVLQSWETPWQLIGPVLPGEEPIKQPTLPLGTYPTWSGSVVYDTGQRVLFEGIPFQAKWWNQGDSPAASAANSDGSPWLPLSQQEILEILEEIEAGTFRTPTPVPTPTPRPISTPVAATPSAAAE